MEKCWKFNVIPDEVLPILEQSLICTSFDRGTITYIYNRRNNNETPAILRKPICKYKSGFFHMNVNLLSWIFSKIFRFTPQETILFPVHNSQRKSWKTVKMPGNSQKRKQLQLCYFSDGQPTEILGVSVRYANGSNIQFHLGYFFDMTWLGRINYV